MANKGYIYRGAKPVYWSLANQPLLKQRLNTMTVSTSLYYANKVKDGKGVQIQTLTSLSGQQPIYGYSFVD